MKIIMKLALCITLIMLVYLIIIRDNTTATLIPVSVNLKTGPSINPIMKRAIVDYDSDRGVCIYQNQYLRLVNGWEDFSNTAPPFQESYWPEDVFEASCVPNKPGASIMISDFRNESYSAINDAWVNVNDAYQTFSKIYGERMYPNKITIQAHAFWGTNSQFVPTWHANFPTEALDRLLLADSIRWKKIKEEGHGEPLEGKEHWKLENDVCSYPAALDPVTIAHELTHAYVSQPGHAFDQLKTVAVGNYNWHGAFNEHFADFAAVRYFYEKTKRTVWKIGFENLKDPYKCKPNRDFEKPEFKTISDASQGGTPELHKVAEVYNFALYRLAHAYSHDIVMLFNVYAVAEKKYWNSAESEQDYIDGLYKAALDLKDTDLADDIITEFNEIRTLRTD